MGTEQCFRRGPLKEGTRLGVHGGTQKIVGGGVTYVELDRGIEFDQFHQVRFAEASLLARRLRLKCLCAQLLQRMQRCDTEANFLRETELQQQGKTIKANTADR